MKALRRLSLSLTAMMKNDNTLTPHPAVICNPPAPAVRDVSLLCLLFPVHSGLDRQKE